MKHEKILQEIEQQLMENRVTLSHSVFTNEIKHLRANNNLLGKIKTILKDTDKEYERGCEDAWELARKLFGSTNNGAYSASEFYKIFDNRPITIAMEEHSYKEALAKVEAYEKKKKEEEEAKKIVFGDVVECKGLVNTYIGIFVSEIDDKYAVLMNDCNKELQLLTKSNWTLTKTGKHFDIQGMLDEIGE